VASTIGTVSVAVAADVAQNSLSGGHASEETVPGNEKNPGPERVPPDGTRTARLRVGESAVTTGAKTTAGAFPSPSGGRASRETNTGVRESSSPKRVPPDKSRGARVRVDKSALTAGTTAGAAAINSAPPPPDGGHAREETIAGSGTNPRPERTPPDRTRTARLKIGATTFATTSSEASWVARLTRGGKCAWKAKRRFREARGLGRRGALNLERFKRREKIAGRQRLSRR
jgi:hypothetical protein